MVQALAATDIRMWGMDAKLRAVKSSTNEDNARLAASTMVRGSQRKSHAAFEQEIQDEEAKLELVRTEAIAALRRLRMVGDGIMRIAQYRIFAGSGWLARRSRRRSRDVHGRQPAPRAKPDEVAQHRQELPKQSW